MKKGIFICSPDKRTAYAFEKKLREELNLKAKEVINDLGMIGEDMGIVIYIDKGDIPSDYQLKGQKIFILTEGMDFNRWEKFDARNIIVIKIDDTLVYLQQELTKFGYSFSESKKRIEDTELKPYLAGEKLVDKAGLIGIYSIKDGIGKSTIALNLAGYIKEVSPETRVLLLDLDSNFSSLRRFVEKNIGISQIDLGDNSILEKLNKKMYKYIKSELYIIPYEKDVDIDIQKASILVEMLKELKKHFDLIIIDINSQVDEKLLTILNCISTMFLVSDNRNQVKNDTAVFAKNILPSIGVKVPELYVIINKDSDSFSADSFEDKYTLKVAGVVDWDSDIPKYESKKLIYSLGNRKGSLASCMQSIIKVLGLEAHKKVKTKFQDIFQ